LTGLGDKIDYLSIHRYWENSPDYYTYMGQSAMDFEEKIIIPAAAIKTAKTMMGFTNPIYISFDEWGVRGRDLLSVLPVIQCLNSFVRHADVVKMANFTMMTSLLATEPGKGSFKSPLFYSFQLFSNNCLGNSIDTYVECDTFNTEKCQGIPFLDVTSTYSKETNTVYINVLNRHKDNAITADIVNTSGTLSGKAIATLINSVSLNEPFVFDKQKEYIPVSKEIAIKGNKMSCSFPAHSFTQIKVTVEK